MVKADEDVILEKTIVSDLIDVGRWFFLAVHFQRGAQHFFLAVHFQ